MTFAGVGVPWSAWLALAGALLVGAVPSSAAVRTSALAGAGRLVAVRAGVGRRLTPRALPPARAGFTAGVGVVALVGLRWGIALAVALGAIAATAGLLVRDVVTGRRRARARRDLLTAVGVLGEELAAGSRPADALSAAASLPGVAVAFGPAAQAQARGADPADVLMGSEIDAVRAVGVAWRLGDTTGAALAGVVARVAADLTAADDQRRAVRVALAGPRSSAALLSALPALGIVLGLAMGAHPVAFLTGAGTGRVLCCVGVLLDAAGVLWMRRIVRRVDPS